MKSIRKDVVVDLKSIQNIHIEKIILLQVQHPFIISMDYVFVKSTRIYFIMNYIRGGELFKYLSESKRFPENRAKFYAAQIAIALGYLHSSNIIYRDLKPENILISEDGYIQLADFGLAKIKNSDADDPNSFCGTPEYLAPEMIVGSGHDHTLDWWALGILLYEMMIGVPPFFNKNKHQMYYLI
jgi:serine/threonine protein kinase